MYGYLQQTVLKDAPIDYLEFGVADGASLRSWCALNQRPESRFFGFDTFTGLPEDWAADHPKGTFNRDGIPPRHRRNAALLSSCRYPVRQRTEQIKGRNVVVK